MQYKLDDPIVQTLLPYCVNASDFGAKGLSNLARQIVPLQLYVKKKEEGSGKAAASEATKTPAANVVNKSQNMVSDSTAGTRSGAKRPLDGKEIISLESTKCSKIMTIGAPLKDGEIPEGLLLHGVNEMYVEDALLTVVDVM